ncbi:MAG: hypothetical protein AB7S56_00870 [Halothiobacillaceae bacterium]
MHAVTDDNERIPLNDSRVPQAVREHIQNRRLPVCHLIALGHDEFMLLDAKG